MGNAAGGPGLFQSKKGKTSPGPKKPSTNQCRRLISRRGQSGLVHDIPELQRLEKSVPALYKNMRTLFGACSLTDWTPVQRTGAAVFSGNIKSLSLVDMPTLGCQR